MISLCSSIMCLKERCCSSTWFVYSNPEVVLIAHFLDGASLFRSALPRETPWKPFIEIRRPLCGVTTRGVVAFPPGELRAPFAKGGTLSSEVCFGTVYNGSPLSTNGPPTKPNAQCAKNSQFGPIVGGASQRFTVVPHCKPHKRFTVGPSCELTDLRLQRSRTVDG